MALSSWLGLACFHLPVSCLLMLIALRKQKKQRLIFTASTGKTKVWLLLFVNFRSPGRAKLSSNSYEWRNQDNDENQPQSCSLQVLAADRWKLGVNL